MPSRRRGAVVACVALSVASCGEVRDEEGKGSEGDASRQVERDGSGADELSDASAASDPSRSRDSSSTALTASCPTTIDAYCAAPSACIRDWPSDPTAFCPLVGLGEHLYVGSIGPYRVARAVGQDYSTQFVFDGKTGVIVEIRGGNGPCVAGPPGGIALLGTEILGDLVQCPGPGGFPGPRKQPDAGGP